MTLGWLSKLSSLLKPNGAIIASIPNVCHFSVLRPLIFQGEWEYVNKGVLDRTHLRFFTRKTAIKLFESSDLKVDMIKERDIVRGSKAWIANLITFSMFKQFFVLQYLIRAKKN